MLEAEVKEKFADNGQRRQVLNWTADAQAHNQDPHAVLLLEHRYQQGSRTIKGGFMVKQGNTAGADLSQLHPPLKANAEADRHPRPLLTNKLERVGLSVGNSPDQTGLDGTAQKRRDRPDHDQHPGELLPRG